MTDVDHARVERIPIIDVDVHTAVPPMLPAVTQYLPARFPYAVMEWFGRLPVLGQAAVLAAALMLTNTMGPEGVAPFIYFRF